MSSDNKINQIRPESTFENFLVYHDGQKKVVDALTTIADQLVRFAPEIAGNEYPFPHGQIIFVWSEPGHGKSHLLESLAHHVIDKEPSMAQSMFLARENFTLKHIGITDLYDKMPIVLIDDLFAEHQSVDSLHPNTDLKCMMNFLASVYERRTLVIATSNFPMLSDDGIIKRIAEVDKIGRALSRCNELLSMAGEMYLPGHDYRETIADERRSRSAQKRTSLWLPSHE